MDFISHALSTNFCFKSVHVFDIIYLPMKFQVPKDREGVLSTVKTNIQISLALTLHKPYHIHASQ